MHSVTVTQQKGITICLTIPPPPLLLLATCLFSILYGSQFGLFLSRFGNLVPGAFLLGVRRPSPFRRKSPRIEDAESTPNSKMFYSHCAQLELLALLDQIYQPRFTSFNYAHNYGELSNSQKQAVITLVEKKGKDKRLIKNWRPISLILMWTPK